MHDPLTSAEYKAIAENITFPVNAFINGAFQLSKSGKTFTSFNPAARQSLAEIAACDVSDVDFAAQTTREAFEDGRWCKLSPDPRKTTLLKLARLIEENRHELAVLETPDSGKPVSECQTVDLPEAVKMIRWHAELIDKLYDQTAQVGSGSLAMIVREPVGVVGCVLPWNFPLLMLTWKIGAACSRMFGYCETGGGHISDHVAGC